LHENGHDIHDREKADRLVDGWRRGPVDEDAHELGRGHLHGDRDEQEGRERDNQPPLRAQGGRQQLPPVAKTHVAVLLVTAARSAEFGSLSCSNPPYTGGLSNLAMASSS